MDTEEVGREAVSLMSEWETSRLVAKRYRLIKSLGKGSFGEVFEAEDVQFEPPRRIAVKVLHPHYVTESNVREDLKREAGVLARFNHPNILRVIDFGITEEGGYIVTDLATGGSLAQKLRPDPSLPAAQLPLNEVADYLEQLADALDEAHSHGLLHRDIKPQNILLDGRGRPLLADFGLATAVSASASSLMVNTTPSGTPLYMAPEQWQGQAGRASDIYALGAVVFQMLTGQPPFLGSQFELMGQHMSARIPRLADRAPALRYPPNLDAVLALVLEKDPRNRLRPAKEFARRFRAVLSEPATSVADSTRAPYAVPSYTPPAWNSPATPNPEEGLMTLPLTAEGLPAHAAIPPDRKPTVATGNSPYMPPGIMPPANSNSPQYLPGIIPPANVPPAPLAPRPYQPMHFNYAEAKKQLEYHVKQKKQLTPAERKFRFYRHLSSYAIIMAFLWLIFFATGVSYPWPIWAMLGWGIGIAFDAVNTFLTPPS